MRQKLAGWKTSQALAVFVASAICLGGACFERGDPNKQKTKRAPSQASAADLPKDRGTLEKLTWKTLRDAPELRRLAPLIVALRSALQREPLSEEDHLTVTMILENVCERRLNWPRLQYGSRGWYQEVWKACGPKGSNLVSPAVRNQWGGLAIWVATLHGLLRRAKVRPALARALSRVWLRPHPRMTQARRGVALPKVRIEQALAHQSLLTVTETKLFLNGRVLPVARKGTGLDSPDRLTTALAERRSHTSKLRKGARGHLGLIAAAKTPYVIVRHVLACASKAGYERVHLVARGDSDEPGIIEVYTKKPFKESSQKPGLGLGLKVTAKGYFIHSRFGSECQPGVPENAPVCLPPPGAKLTPAITRDLSHHLWYLFAAKYKDPSSYPSPKERFLLTVTAEDTVAYGDVLRALAAVVTIPHDAKNPPVRQRVPGSGCRRDYKRSDQSWRYPYGRGGNFREIACMYDVRVLK
ncbi:MAG: hypothetical protein ABI333_28675 [bacterium]